MEKPDTTCYCILLRQASRRMTEVYESELAPFELTLPQYSLLRTALRVGSVGVSELAERLKLDRTTLTRNLKVLEDRGLIQLKPNPQDQRERLVTLSRRGQRSIEEAKSGWDKAQARIHSQLSAEKIRLLRELVQDLEGV